MICSSLNRFFFISASFRRSPIQTEGASGGNVRGNVNVIGTMDCRLTSRSNLTRGCRCAFCDNYYEEAMSKPYCFGFDKTWSANVSASPLKSRNSKI